jgi:hypothetical protein
MTPSPEVYRPVLSATACSIAKMEGLALARKVDLASPEAKWSHIEEMVEGQLVNCNRASLA